MPTIEKLRTVLLTSPYADENDPEIKFSFAHGPARTIGMVEITLDDGTVGLGEGYLAVFAPHVFEQIVSVLGPYVLGKDAFDINARVRDLCMASDYWSQQGAARHVVSAFEIALVDAKAKRLGVPAHQLFGGKKTDAIELYASGGCHDVKQYMQQELDLVKDLGLKIFKMRAVNQEICRTAWTLEAAGKMGIAVGVDMCQNLVNPAQGVADVMRYVRAVADRTKYEMLFLEEALGPMDLDGFRMLRAEAPCKVCGGETITTPQELAQRLAYGCYDFAQPDATVVGGISAVMEVFTAARVSGSSVVPHAWSGPVALMANYHAAFAGGAGLAEYPILDFPVREDMLTEPLGIIEGKISAPEALGIGVTLTAEIEEKYPFREEAVYNCQGLEFESPPDSAWA